jgi:hypothetical protein
LLLIQFLLFIFSFYLSRFAGHLPLYCLIGSVPVGAFQLGLLGFDFPWPGAARRAVEVGNGFGSPVPFVSGDIRFGHGVPSFIDF